MKEKIKKGGAVAIVVVLCLAILLGMSWIVTCGLIKLITMCFGLEFSWPVATGIWLIMIMLRNILNATVKKD